MYTLELKGSVWYINGVKLVLPRDQQDDAVSLLAGLDDDGNVIPVTVNGSTGAIAVSVDDQSYLQMILSRPPDAIDERPDDIKGESVYSGWKVNLSGISTDAVWIINLYTPVTDIHSAFVERFWAGSLSSPVKWSDRETLLPIP